MEKPVVGLVVQVIEIQHRAELDVLELVDQQQRQSDRIGRQGGRDRAERVPCGGTDLAARREPPPAA